MQTDEIKYYIKNIARNILRILKETRKQPNFWKYIALAIVLTALFLLLTFPYNVLIRNQLQTIGDKIGKNIYIGDINFSLVDSTSINDISINFDDKSEINLQNSNINIGILPALFKKSIKGYLKIQNLKYTKDKISVSSVFSSDLNLKSISFSEFNKTNGEIKFELQNIIANGINIKGFDIPPLRFSLINANLNIMNNKITINDFMFTGPDLKGRISGSIAGPNLKGRIATNTIKPSTYFRQAQLNLNITVDSSSAILENYKILLESLIDDSNKIQLNISGTISNPKVNTNKTGQRVSNRKTDTLDADEMRNDREAPDIKADTYDAREAGMIKKRRESNIKRSKNFRTPPRRDIPDIFD